MDPVELSARLRVHGGGIALALAGLALAPPVALQAGEQTPTFRAEARLVVLHATVRNARGELVTNLDRSAFTVFEDGKRQPITLFRRDDIPVSLGLLIDNSGSMRPHRARVEASALALVRASNPEDEVFVLNFADTPRIDVPLTSDPAVLESRSARVDATGGTALRDAVAMGETYLEQHASRDRRALVVVTDGNDNASATTMAEIQKRSEANDIVVYGVGLFGEPSSSGARLGRRELEQMTERTGGIGYYPAGIDQIEAVAIELARQIRNQYTLAYAPSNQRLDGSYRSIRVKAVGPVRGERLEVRTRAGYRAAPGSRP